MANKKVKKKPQPAAGKVKTTTVVPNGSDGALEITFRGSPAAVRAALHNVRFASPWDIATARGIALDETIASDAVLDDTLGGDKILMRSEDDRELYRTRCCNAAAALGHRVPAAQQSKITVDADTTVREVAQALYDSAV